MSEVGRVRTSSRKIRPATAKWIKSVTPRRPVACEQRKARRRGANPERKISYKRRVNRYEIPSDSEAETGKTWWQRRLIVLTSLRFNVMIHGNWLDSPRLRERPFPFPKRSGKNNDKLEYVDRHFLPGARVKRDLRFPEQKHGWFLICPLD